MSTVIYGIKNCDTIKKALSWLNNSSQAYTFHDYRKDGLTKTMLTNIVEHLGWEQLVNKRGTTYRSLTDEQKNGLNRNSAIDLMLENPALIKRPLLIHNKEYHLGFKQEQYLAIFDDSHHG